MQILAVWNQILWQWVLPVLLTAAALLWAVRLRGRPLRGFGGVLRETYGTLLRRDRKQHGIFASALAAMMGTGNLVGTAYALISGGAGAIFWMWISALLGMVLVYAENLLGSRYRTKRRDGSMLGGALGYLHSGVGSRRLARIFAVCCVGAALGMGNLVQSSAIAQTVRTWQVPAAAAGIITAGILGGILIGGAERIRRAAGVLMPLLCGCYLVGCLWLLVLHAQAIPDALTRIFSEAFGMRAAGSGICASVFLRSMRVGLQRGIFSNEAGLGSSALLHMDADAADDTSQSKWAAAEVFADTMICCTATALVILTAPHCSIPDYTDGAALLLAAFSEGLGGLAAGFLAVCMVLLAFATMIGWYPCGAAAVRYLCGARGMPVYLAAYLLAAFAGALGNPAWLWTLCDCCNGCMALPNLYAMLVLLPRVSVQPQQHCRGHMRADRGHS